MTETTRPRCSPTTTAAATHRFSVRPGAAARGPDQHRFTAHDIAAVATLSVPLPGEAVVGLIERDGDLAAKLRLVPTDVDLAGASDADLDALFAVQRDLDNIAKIGHVIRSKPLAHKRPRVVPIRDQYVLMALLGRDSGEFTKPLRDALAADASISDRLRHLKRYAGVDERVSTLRVLDVIVWMATHGATPTGVVPERGQ